MGVSPTAELHGNALIQRTDEWLTMAPMVRARIGVYEAALDAIASADGLHLFLVVSIGLDSG
jgi:1,2-phenylacetyl-CoA epoxidase catalytic subunit